jgi:hypothetical protein
MTLEKTNVDVNQLIDADGQSTSIIYSPSSYTKPKSNII